MASRWYDNESYWIHLYHHLLLAATERDSSAFVWLNGEFLQRDFDAYFAGITKRSIQELNDMRNDLVPGVMQRLRMSQQEVVATNLRTDISHITITETMLGDYIEIVTDECFALPDVPSKDLTRLWTFLNNNIRIQLSAATLTSLVPHSVILDAEQDDTAYFALQARISGHGTPKRDANYNPEAKLSELETITRGDDGSIQAIFRLNVPVNEDGTKSVEFVQSETLPFKTSDPSSDPTATYALPDPTRHMLPAPVRSQEWSRTSPTEFIWIRGDERWSPKACFWVLDKANHAYVTCEYSTTTFTEQIDPNSRLWRATYNRFLRQILEKYVSDHVFDKPKVPWITFERHILYRCINLWCRENGLHKFPPDTPSFYETTADEINTECRNENGHVERNVAAVRGQIKNALRGKTKINRAISQLAGKIAALKRKFERAEPVSQDESHPKNAIDMADSDEEEGG